MPVSSMEARTNRKGIVVGNQDPNGSRGAAEPDCCGPRHRSQDGAEVTRCGRRSERCDRPHPNLALRDAQIARDIARRSGEAIPYTSFCEFASKLSAHHPETIEEVRFDAALREGDVDGVRELLSVDVVAIGDGGGNVDAGVNPVIGNEAVSRLLTGLSRKFSGSVRLQTALVNGLPGIAGFTKDGAAYVIVGFDFNGRQISAIYSVVNPDKLVHVNRR